MKRIVLALGVFGAVAAVAMPTRQELVAAQKAVKAATVEDVMALKAGERKPGDVAAAHVALAEQAATEAEAYLLLQGAFGLYAKAKAYDAAADVLEKMSQTISDLRPGVVLELCDRAAIRSLREKSPRLYAIREAARQSVRESRAHSASEKAASAALPEVEGGDPYKFVLDAKKNVAVELAACPPGEIKMWETSHKNSDNQKVHLLRLTYPFLMMTGQMTFGELEAIDAKVADKVKRRYFSAYDPAFRNFAEAQHLTGGLMVGSVTLKELETLLKKLNEQVWRQPKFRAFKGYAFRIATEAEHQYALCAEQDFDSMTALDGKDWRKAYWQAQEAFPKSVLDRQKRDWEFPLPTRSYVQETFRGNGWGIDAMMRELHNAVCDTIPFVMNEKTGKPAWRIDGCDGPVADVSKYADEEVDPVRLFKGKNAHRVSLAGTHWKCQMRDALADAPKADIGPVRLVFAPKLSALNVYPRTAKAGPLKTVGGAAAVGGPAEK